VVYVLSGSSFEFEQRLPVDSDIEDNEQFATAVSISNKFIAVGSRNDNGASDLDPKQGAVQIFNRGTGADPWVSSQRLLPPNAGTDDGSQYGFSVALGGPLLCVGAPSLNGGFVHVYHRDTGVYGFKQTLVSPNPSTDPNKPGLFGFAISVFFDTLSVQQLIVGEPGSQVFGGTVRPTEQIGRVHVFEGKSVGLKQFKPVPVASFSPASEAQHFFGGAVDTDGVRFVVGAPLSNTAFVYQGLGATPNLLNELVSSPAIAGGYGTSVAIHFVRAFVGAPFSGEATNSGQVVAFELVGGNFVQSAIQPVPDPSLLDTGSDFGFSTAASRDFLVVGAPRDDTTVTDPAPETFNGTGSTFVFDLPLTVSS
jgi:hypothetical protein